MEYLKIKNWDKYQHYKHRNPPWIKLHRDLLNDSRFMSLPLASKGLLMQLWILGSEYEGKVPYDLKELQFRFRDKSIKIGQINTLISKGFLNNCKQMLADAPKSLSETETETEKRQKYIVGAKNVLEYLNEKTSREFKRTNDIEARLKDGGTIEQCKQIIDSKLQDPFFQINPKYYNPTTIFRKSHWDKYLNETKETTEDGLKRFLRRHGQSEEVV